MTAERPPDEQILPIVEERVTIGRRRVVTGRVRVSTVTDCIDSVLETPLASDEVDVVHVPVGREIETMPEVRSEGDTLIIPVVEEVPVIVRRLVLKEEIHVTRRRGQAVHALQVQLLKQRAVITREGRDRNNERNQPMAETGFGGRTLTAFFDTRADAEAAMTRLTALGVSDVRLTGGEEFAGREDMGRDRGFWESISDFFFPAEDRATYAEGLRRGGFLVTARDVPDGVYDQAVDILDAEGSVDLDERAESWRAEGWAAPGAAYDDGFTSESVRGDRTLGDAAVAGTAAPLDTEGRAAYGAGDLDADLEADAARRATATGLEGEEVIPVVQESLRVGKRDVGLGRVRVRSYLVEEPVSEDVTLREERVEIERRPVDRPFEGDAAAFTDRTIEAEEHAEEAVVSKEARVVEEIALRKRAEERTETVSDTVRRTEVEVEDDRDGSLNRDGLTDKPLDR